MERDALKQPQTDPLASDLVVACEAAWRTIQSHHPELPEVVMLLGTGVERGRLVKLGHWWSGRWIADGNVRGEVLLAGEALHLKPDAVFEVLLHEAAHGINAARGVQDTSRGGRYHNARFKSTAIEVGLTVAQMDPYGFAQTELGDLATQRYADDITKLAAAMRIARRIPGSALSEAEVDGQTGTEGTPGAGGGESQREKVRPAECGCGRRMRMAPSVFAQGPVTCGNCGAEFLIGREAVRTTPADSVVSSSFLDRRSAQLDETPTQDRSEELLRREACGADGLDVILRLGAWRAGLAADAGRPLRINDTDERDRWDHLARAVLTIDGVLHGPTINASDDLELRAGDRVVVDLPSGEDALDLPDDGALGVVTVIEPNSREVAIDFPTAGTFVLHADSAETAALSYSYCELERPAIAAHPSRIARPPARALRLCPEPDADLDLGIDL